MSRPFAAFSTDSAVSVPEGIDATGGTDVATALAAFIAGVPDGAAISFPASGVYRIDSALRLNGRSRLSLLGNGATIRNERAQNDISASLFYVNAASTDILIDGFALVGNSPTPGVYIIGQEAQHAVFTIGQRVEVRDCSISAVLGDAFSVWGSAGGAWFHDNHVLTCGRNGVTVIAGSNVTAEGNAFDACGYTLFDLEPNTADEVIDGVYFLDNTAGTWTNSFLSAEGAAGSTIRNVEIRRNTVTGDSLRSYVRLARRSGVAFTDNVSLVPVAGPVLSFANIDGLTVGGNVQPLTKAPLATYADCTAVAIRPPATGLIG